MKKIYISSILIFFVLVFDSGQYLAQQPPSDSSLSSQKLQDAREIARRLREEYPGWKDGLDACPCTRSEAWKTFRFEDATHSLTGIYHPGAVSEYRSVARVVGTYTSKKPGAPVLRPGQQCTYDAKGNLITGGAGAGTPDAYSPSVTSTGQGLYSKNSHTFWDVKPFEAMRNIRQDGWKEYQQTWTPNNGNVCPHNIAPSEEREQSSETNSIEGVWNWRCCQGKYYGDMRLHQNGNRVTGTIYSPVNNTGGDIDGTIQDNRLRFTRSWEDKSQIYTLTLSSDEQVLEGTFKGFKDPDQSIGVEFRATRRGDNNRISLDGLWNDAWGTGAWRIQHNPNSNQFTVFLPESYARSSHRKGPYEGHFIGENAIEVRFYDDPANPASCCTATLTSNARELKWSNGGTWSR